MTKGRDLSPVAEVFHASNIQASELPAQQSRASCWILQQFRLQ
jgi:hypothetical protein